MTQDDLTIEQLSALAQQTRFNVFRTLMRAAPAGLPAGVLASELDVAPNTLSAHLGILTRAGLTSMRREGRSLIYSADTAAVSALIRSLMQDCCGGHPDVCGPLALAAEGACTEAS